MFVLNRKEMYHYDSSTISKIGIPGRILMENAGKGCSDYIEQNLLEHKSKIIVFCGSGNNGGDGFVVARWLKNYGHQIVVVAVDDIKKMKEETKANHDLVISHNIPIFKITSFAEWENLNMNLKNFDLIIDAMLGIGFHGEIKDWKKELIQEINAVENYVVSIDIPTGVDCDTGISTYAVNADYTLTMADFKLGHFIGEGRVKSGVVKIINIGIPSKLYDEYHPKTELVTIDNIHFPKRKLNYHKGHFGKIGIIAGSPGFTGAAFMAAEAALYSGAGLITLCHPKGMENIFESKLTEVMKYSMEETKNGEYNLEKILSKLNSFDAILVGPGWGVSEKNSKLLKEILSKWNKPLILDADAINILSDNREWIKDLSNENIVITPHFGEFARLINKDTEQLRHNPVNHAKEFAYKTGIKVLLKNNTTLFTDGRNVRINISGNDGLATGGSGDVLAGIIISFVGQKLSVIEAPISASYLLGKTAEKIAETRGTASIVPTEIIKHLFMK